MVAEAAFAQAESVQPTFRFTARGEEIAEPVAQGLQTKKDACVVLPLVHRRSPVQKRKETLAADALEQVRQEALCAAARELGLDSLPEPPALGLIDAFSNKAAASGATEQRAEPCRMEHAPTPATSFLSGAQTSRALSADATARRLPSKKSTQVHRTTKLTSAQMQANWDAL